METPHSDSHRIIYTFLLPGGSRVEFTLLLDRTTLNLVTGSEEAPPPWTRLQFHKCPHCPLEPSTTSLCPLAASLVSIVDRFDGLLSYEKLFVEVRTIERIVSQETTAQRGISSLLGLVFATSGCPHTSFLKPMARFHLPLASADAECNRDRLAGQRSHRTGHLRKDPGACD
jgi:hypothetical protein